MKVNIFDGGIDFKKKIILNICILYILSIGIGFLKVLFW